MPDNNKQGRTSNKAMTFFVCFLAALAGLLFGLDIGVIAGALPFITDEFQISAHTQEWVVSSMMFGAAVAGIIALVYALIAATIALTRRFGTLEALGIVGGVAFVVMLGFLLALWLEARRHRQQAAR